MHLMHSLRHNESGVKVLAKKAVSSVYSSSQTRTHHVDSLILLDSSSSLWMLLFADRFICVVTAEQWTHTTGFERQSRPELLQVEKTFFCGSRKDMPNILEERYSKCMCACMMRKEVCYNGDSHINSAAPPPSCRVIIRGGGRRRESSDG